MDFSRALSGQIDWPFEIEIFTGVRMDLANRISGTRKDADFMAQQGHTHVWVEF